MCVNWSLLELVILLLELRLRYNTLREHNTSAYFFPHTRTSQTDCTTIIYTGKSKRQIGSSACSSHILQFNCHHCSPHIFVSSLWIDPRTVSTFRPLIACIISPATSQVICTWQEIPCLMPIPFDGISLPPWSCEPHPIQSICPCDICVGLLLTGISCCRRYPPGHLQRQTDIATEQSVQFTASCTHRLFCTFFLRRWAVLLALYFIHHLSQPVVIQGPEPQPICSSVTSALTCTQRKTTACSCLANDCLSLPLYSVMGHTRRVASVHATSVWACYTKGCYVNGVTQVIARSGLMYCSSDEDGNLANRTAPGFLHSPSFLHHLCLCWYLYLQSISSLRQLQFIYGFHLLRLL